MVTNQTNVNSRIVFLGKLLRKSHRTLPEQIVGLGIYLLISIAFQFLCPISANAYGFLYGSLLGASMWALWRVYSLRVLKLELSIFLAQFFFQTFLYVSSFALEQDLLALVALLMLWSNAMLAILLFWKKEKLSGLLLVFPVAWIFYLTCLSMLACMSIP